MKRGIRWSGLGLVSLVICLLAKPDVSQAQPCDFSAFLYLSGASPNLELDPLDPEAPGDLPNVPTFIDSPSLTKAGGNPYRQIGTWSTGTGLVGADCTPTVFAYHPHVWLGLRNSDDQGTQFDLRAELLKGSVVVAEGEIHCVKGVTRNPANALEVIIPFDSSGPTFDPSCGPSDAFTVEADSQLSLRLYARIGTDVDGPCKGHSTATGVRLYYDAISRPSQVLVTSDTVCCTPGCDNLPCLPPVCFKPPVRD